MEIFYSSLSRYLCITQNGKVKPSFKCKKKQKIKKKHGDFLDFFFSMYCIQHWFICRPSDSTVSEDAGIEPLTVATSALTVRRSNH
jgi:hypothetical protein